MLQLGSLRTDLRANGSLGYSLLLFLQLVSCNSVYLYIHKHVSTAMNDYSIQIEDPEVENSIVEDSIVFQLTPQNEQVTLILTAESDGRAVEGSKGFLLMASLINGNLLENEFFLQPLVVFIIETKSDSKIKIHSQLTLLYYSFSDSYKHWLQFSELLCH